MSAGALDGLAATIEKVRGRLASYLQELQPVLLLLLGSAIVLGSVRLRSVWFGSLRTMVRRGIVTVRLGVRAAPRSISFQNSVAASFLFIVQWRRRGD